MANSQVCKYFTLMRVHSTRARTTTTTNGNASDEGSMTFNSWKFAIRNRNISAFACWHRISIRFHENMNPQKIKIKQISNNSSVKCPKLWTNLGESLKWMRWSGIWILCIVFHLLFYFITSFIFFICNW